MATIKNGILGPLEGPVASVVGYIRLGIPVLRSKPEPKAYTRSEKQVATNKRFAFAMKFVKPAKPFLNVGFSVDKPKGQTAHNIAVSKALSAITADGPDLLFDFATLLVASGDLEGALNPRVEMTATATLRFHWNQYEKQSYQRGQDQAMLLAYMPEEDLAFFEISGARRSAGQDLLEVYSGKPGQVFETYIAFISDDRKRISTSIYTGQVIVE